MHKLQASRRRAYTPGLKLLILTFKAAGDYSGPGGVGNYVTDAGPLQ